MTNNIRWGLDNPHPFSQMKTELIWEGKYNETIDEPASRAMVQGNLFNPTKAHHDDFRNRLMRGDNKLVKASLLKEFAKALTIHSGYDFYRDRTKKNDPHAFLA